MGNRGSKLFAKHTAQKSRVAKREMAPQEQPPDPPANTMSPRVSALEQPTRSRVKSAPQKVHNSDDLRTSSQRSRTKSAPQKRLSMKTGEGVPPLPPLPSHTSRAGAAPRKEQTTKDSPRFRSRSAPQKVQSVKGGEDSPPLPSQRFRAKSSNASSTRSPSSDIKLLSTVRQLLPEDFKFRILVVGKNSSGKSSLIKAVFKVDLTGVPERTLGKADIDVEFRPEDNRYLIVHECSGLESQTEDSQNFMLQTIREFILRRTDASCPPSARLHAVWICIPASDVIDRRLGDGVQEILGLKTVPVVIVFTKFDVVVSQVLLDIAGGDTRYHERARARAHTIYEDACRYILHKEPRDVPAVIFSENTRFIDLVDNLVVTTDTFISTDSHSPSRGTGVREAKQRIGAVPLAWSAALRVNYDISIQASIEVGRNGHWRNLWPGPDLAHKTLKNCVNIIHLDMVEVWNMNDKSKYLLSDEFKAKMSHLVKDLAESANASSSSYPTRAGDVYAAWVHDVYRGGRENVRCVMGYIVDLSVIMYGIFQMAVDNMSPKDAQQALERHVQSGHRDAIHHDIRNFVAEVHPIRYLAPQKDLVLERIIDLIKQFCVPPSGNS